MSMKNPWTPTGIEPATFRFVAQHLNHCATAVPKNSKLRMYKTLVRPAVTYACETWALKGNIKTKLRAFEMKVLRRIYGLTKQKDGTRQIKSNEELNRLTGNKNIINCIKTQRLAWFRNVHHMPGNSMVKKVYECSPAITRSLGRRKIDGRMI